MLLPLRCLALVPATAPGNVHKCEYRMSAFCQSRAQTLDGSNSHLEAGGAFSGAHCGEGGEKKMMKKDTWESEEVRDGGGYKHNRNFNKNNMYLVDSCHLKNTLSH